MGLLNSALQIGRSAILSYQGALQTVGGNVSSAGSPDYTRLAPQLDPIAGSVIANGLQPGAGVALTDIRRYIDDALEGRLRRAIGTTQAALARQSTLAQVESFLDDTTGAEIPTRLGNFFQAFDNLQNTPEDPASRDLAIAAGSQLADSLRQLRTQFERLGEDLDGQIGSLVDEANDIAAEVADLNSKITTSEAGRRGQATALRDQRDALLRRLSELFDVTVREQPDGSLNVYLGSEALVQGNVSRGLVAVTENQGEFIRTSVRFADTNQQVEFREGQMAGLIRARDEDAYGRVAGLDELAAGIIMEVNRIHADGQGLDAYKSVVGSFDVLAPDAVLNQAGAGLSSPPQGGSFYLTVLDDSTQTPVAHRIEVNFDGANGGTTLQSLVDDINAQVDGVTASVTSDYRFALTADEGYSFAFGYDGQQTRTDTSGVLAALGVNTFFTGADARNIAVNPAVQANPLLVAAGSVFLPGDGANARRIAALDVMTSDWLAGVSIPAFFNGIANSVAVTAAGANSDVEAASAVQSSLQAQKESISGVNLDEEAIALVKYQRAFQGAARFVSVVDQMIGELVNIIR